MLRFLKVLNKSGLSKLNLKNGNPIWNGSNVSTIRNPCHVIGEFCVSLYFGDVDVNVVGYNIHRLFGGMGKDPILIAQNWIVEHSGNMFCMVIHGGVQLTLSHH
jgi:hypothetical protein